MLSTEGLAFDELLLLALGMALQKEIILLPAIYLPYPSQPRFNFPVNQQTVPDQLV